MMATVMDGWARVLASDTPVQVALGLSQGWQSLGWGVVLAWLGTLVVSYFSASRALRAGVALVLTLWTWLPGPWSPDYWIGLAFQMPSLMTVLLCGHLLWCRLGMSAADQDQESWGAVSVWALAVFGVLLGWALLLDAFALLPLQLYAWGFSPLASALLVPAACLPWLLSRSGVVRSVRAWLPLGAVLGFAATHLPSGNVWDAVLDPWLWLVLHPVVLRAAWKRR